MRLYSLKGIGQGIHSGLAEVASHFWQGYAKIETVAPFQPITFPTRQSLNDWLYQIYLQHYRQGTLPNMVIIIPGKLLGSWKWAWEGTAFDTHQIAALKEQRGPAMKFVVTHEVGHLLGLDDHYYAFTNCIMFSVPWWMIPLSLRDVCPKCQKILGGR